jgi:hypothetical protein
VHRLDAADLSLRMAGSGEEESVDLPDDDIVVFHRVGPPVDLTEQHDVVPARLFGELARRG